MRIGRKIYYDMSTGSVIVDTGEIAGPTVAQSTTEQDFAAYRTLAERVPSTVGVLQLEYGQYADDFAQCNGYRVDISSDEPTLLFSYPDPTEPEAPLEYRPPLTEEVAALKEQNLTLAEAIADLYEMMLGAE